MSGGQAQRVSIARALALEPTLLICDEILSGLDLPNQINLINLLKRLREKNGMTLLFISHDLDPILKLCRHMIVMEEGRIISAGTVREILTCPDHKRTQILIRHCI